MAEHRRPSNDLGSPQLLDYEHLPGISFGNASSPAPEDGGPSSPNSGAGAGAEPAATRPSSAGTDMPKQVQEVLESDIGVSTMLNRLKQSITAAREFSLFLKKRSALEDDHAKGLKKLCKSTQDSIRHADHRQGSFSQSYEEMLVIHDRMAENGIQFAMSLHQMHEDLLEVAALADKHRKGWKQNGLAAEQRLADVETAMRKSKVKYDSLAEEYERVRTGEAKQGPRVFGIKGPKSAAQHEEDLLRKVQGADTDYMGKVQAYQSEKASIVSTTRPEAVKALWNLINECDSGTTLQMQKFASFNEKLLLSNGLVISPLKGTVPPGPHSRSLKEVVHSIDNTKDLENYLTSFHSKVPPKSSEPKYERNPILNPQHNTSSNQMTQIHQQQGRPSSQQQGQLSSSPQTQIHPPGSVGPRTGAPDSGSSPQSGLQGPNQDFTPPPGIQLSSRPSPGPGHERSFSHGAMLNQSNIQPQPQYNARNSIQAPVAQSRFNSGVNSSVGSASGPPQLGALPFQTRGQSPQRQPGPLNFQSTAHEDSPVRPASPGAASGPKSELASSRGPVFGVSLDRLYENSKGPVPMVVYQCIQAVDLYGLTVEGIYRLSGSTAHVNKLKHLFDTNEDAPILDFRNPENFFHDVNSVAGLLKQFLRDLPDPLLTSEHYAGFIEAAKHDDEVVRRDSLHAIINALPDPNYATLRALTLHLHRVIEHSAVNRMNSQNLAIVFGPTLMGTGPGSNIQDAGWQVRVVDTILQNTYQIFDED
ncbi:RhoGAP-domain-containing protein [Durotheca rogersii]|uniref:RhoGAP-domain-containing protein n=1 Tax=Durotheca rogersii TaxID=419775 RepID=UPI00221FA0FC|nr:RhoGAP-domain-containing protein [Durotheca rogersii]KAI5867596.1 RhoGAP-domain-containing protein [Durotheca rogersii]